MRENWTPLEDAEQEAVIRWAFYEAGRYPGLDLLYAIVARGGKHGLYIEMKRREGGRVSDLQKEWIERLTAQGYECQVCHGFDEAIEVIERYYGRSDSLD